MIRITMASFLGLVLIFLESLIVMKLKGYQTIEFGGIRPFINVWAMNFFLVYTIFTHLWMWYEEKYENIKE